MEQTKLDVKLYIQPNSSYQMKTSELFSACPLATTLSLSTRLRFP